MIQRRLFSRMEMVAMQKTKSMRVSERGNVFLFILLGVALFAALAITMSRSMRSETTTSMAAREAELAAVDILDYVQRIERTINRLRRKSVSENDLSFANSIVAGYTHAQPDTNKIFHGSGGNLTWQSPSPGVNDGSEWVFTGATCLADVGTGATGCDSDTVSNEELIVVLPNVSTSVCEKINDKQPFNGYDNYQTICGSNSTASIYIS